MQLLHKTLSLPFEISSVTVAEIVDCERLTVLVVTNDRSVFAYELESLELRFLFTLPLSVSSQHLKCYSYRNFVALVENKGQNGMVFHLQKTDFLKILVRGDYQIENCSFPIAFYEAGNLTYLIHGTDWNRLDITCLDTDRLLTGRTIDPETNTHYKDYFHSLLSVSPNHKRFISNGWVWHPCDVIYQFEIATFLKDFELSACPVEFPETTGYLWDRPLVWTTSNVIALGYNRQESGGVETGSSELLFININENKMVARIPFDGFDLNEYGEIKGKLFCRRPEKRLLVISEKGLTVTTYEGEVLFVDKGFFPHTYCARHNHFLSLTATGLLLTELSKTASYPIV